MTDTKFKYGDRVRIKKSINCTQCGVCKYIGKIGTINRGFGIGDDSIYVNNFDTMEPGHGCSGFKSKDLELINNDWDI